MQIVPTILTPDIKNKIADLVEDGYDPEDKLKISEALNIPIDVLKNLFQNERHERLIKKAEEISEEFLDIDFEDPAIERKFGKSKLATMKISQAQAMFILETLGKDFGYSKRNELTGKDGKDLPVPIIQINRNVIRTDNSNKQDCELI